MPLQILFTLLIGVLLVPGLAHAQPYSYTTHVLQLTDLGAGVTPKAINNVGQVVGQAADSQAFFWSGGTTTPLGTLGGSQSFANDLNDAGTVVGWSLDANGVQKAFRWTAGDSGLVNLDAGSTLISVAEKINNRDEIVGWRANATVTRSAMWGNGSVVPTNMFSGNSGSHRITGINDDGVVVGVTLDSTGKPDAGFYWDGLDGPNVFTSGFEPYYLPLAGINNVGLSAGSLADIAVYRPANGFIEAIDKILPSDPFSIVYDLNELGQLVGESAGKGFLYDVDSQTLFNLNSFSLATPGFGPILRLTDINNDGAFVGVALVDGVEHGFVGQLVPVPEPDAWIVLSAGAAIVLPLFMRRRQRRAG